MPTQFDMGADDDLYRGVLLYDVQPTREEVNPHFDPNFRQNGSSNDRTKKPWARTIQVPAGPEVSKERVIGPYQSTSPIKAYVTRNRGRHNGKNLRIKCIEKVSGWEEVNV